MKNWELLVSLPLLAIERMPRASWVRGPSNSSVKFLPQIDAPPLPVPVGSPPWSIKLRTFLWKRMSL